MIKINKVPCPSKLTPEKQKSLTERFLKDKYTVWKQPYIEAALLESSHEKCVYCECRLNVESKYMEVEHFHDKKTYPLEVVSWENLLPSCKRCNGHKGNFDTKNSPFINPSSMEPKEHLILNNFRYFPISNAGENTINQLLLNDYSKLVKQRFDITNSALNTLEIIYLDTIDYITGERRTTQLKNRIVNAIGNLMDEATVKSEYAATLATVLNGTTQFKLINEMFTNEGLWNEELQQKLNEIQDICLDTEISKSLDYKRNKIFT